MIARLAALTLLLTSLAAFAAPPQATKPKPGTDEFAIESTVLAAYNVISGPAGRRDWDRFKELFAPGARLTRYHEDEAEVMTPEQYIEKAKPYFTEHPFFEWPVSTKTERFKDIAQVYSRYQGRHAAADEKPYTTGVNLFQLVRSGDRWVILSITWEED